MRRMTIIRGDSTAQPVSRSGPPAEISWLTKFRRKASEHPVISAILGLLGLLATLATIGTALQLNWSYVIMWEERSQRAWSHLTAPMPGESGKGKALMLLMQLHEPLAMINLSCEAIGKWEVVQTSEDSEPRGRCVHPSVFSDISFETNASDRGPIELADRLPRENLNHDVPIFHNQRVEFSDFSRLRPSRDWAADVRFHNVNFYGAILDWEPGVRTDIFETDLTLAVVDARFIKTISGSNISEVIFFAVEDVAGNFPFLTIFGNNRNAKMANSDPPLNWFWADRPPVMVSNFYRSPVTLPFSQLNEVIGRDFRICDPRFRKPLPTRSWAALYPKATDLGEPTPMLYDHQLVEGAAVFRQNGKTIHRKAKTSNNHCPSMTIEDAVAAYPRAYTRDVAKEMRDMKWPQAFMEQ